MLKLSTHLNVINQSRVPYLSWTCYKISLKTTFSVMYWPLNVPWVLDCIILTCMSLKDLALEKATYNWPWEKTGAARKMPVWPWDLLMVIEYDRRMGNWILCNVNGRAASDGASLILGINILSPAFAPVRISASKTVVNPCSARKEKIHKNLFWQNSLNGCSDMNLCYRPHHWSIFGLQYPERLLKSV